MRKEVEEVITIHSNRVGLVPFLQLVENFKKELIRVFLNEHKGNITRAAKYLNLNRTTLLALSQKYGLHPSVTKMRDQVKVSSCVYTKKSSKSAKKALRRCRSCKKINTLLPRDSCPSCGASRQYTRQISHTERKHYVAKQQHRDRTDSVCEASI